MSVTYHMPGGVEGGFGVVTSISSPPEKREGEKSTPLPHESKTERGIVVKLEPRNVAAARQWAEVEMERYGWADRGKEVAHIPVAAAMAEVLQSKEFRPTDKKKTAGRIAPPVRSNSGRGSGEDKP